MKTRVLFKESDVRDPGSVDLWNGWDAALEFGMYAENFQAAARALVHELMADSTFMHSVSARASFRAYPIFYNYRHAFELALKGIIVAASDLLAYEGEPMNEKAVYQSHSFGLLRLDLERVFEAIGWGWDLGIPGFETVGDFRALLSEFDEFDAKSTLWRYPVTIKGTASMETQMTVNVIEFAKTMESLLDLLADVPSIVKDEVDRYMSYLAEAAGHWG
jgi:hypothetical protein